MRECPTNVENVREKIKYTWAPKTPHMQSDCACAVETHVFVFRPGHKYQKENDPNVLGKHLKIDENAPKIETGTYQKPGAGRSSHKNTNKFQNLAKMAPS